VGGTFMEITLDEATKFLDNIMANYSQWHTERAPTSKKVNSVEEISTLSEKVDALMKLVASKNAPIDLNDVPLSTLIEQNSDLVDVNLVSQNNFNNNAYRGNFNPRPFPRNSSNNYGNSYGNSSYNNNRMPSDLESNIKEFINAQKNFNTMIEEKLNKIDDMSRSIDRITHDVENLNINFFPPKVDINESIIALYVSID
jgi:peptidoglycan hydrolase CwlO-like protein